jgi:hypothetical protein
MIDDARNHEREVCVVVVLSVSDSQTFLSRRNSQYIFYVYPDEPPTCGNVYSPEEARADIVFVPTGTDSMKRAQIQYSQIEP